MSLASTRATLEIPTHSKLLWRSGFLQPHQTVQGLGVLLEQHTHLILGFWLASVPELRLVEMQPFTSWADKWKFVGDLRSLLIAHRVPWQRMAWLTESTSRLWAAQSAEPRGRLRCAEPVCAPGACTSLASQQACRIEVFLQSSANYGCFACQCWMAEGPGLPKRWSNGTCRFLRTARPRLPADCGSADL